VTEWYILGAAMFFFALALLTSARRAPARSERRRSRREQEARVLLRELVDTADSLLARIELKSRRLDSMLAELEQKLRAIERSRVSDGEPGAPSRVVSIARQPHRQIEPRRREEEAPAADRPRGPAAGDAKDAGDALRGRLRKRYGEVFDMADEGAEAAEIARACQMTVGEVELILGLRERE